MRLISFTARYLKCSKKEIIEHERGIIKARIKRILAGHSFTNKAEQLTLLHQAKDKSFGIYKIRIPSLMRPKGKSSGYRLICVKIKSRLEGIKEEVFPDFLYLRKNGDKNKISKECRQRLKQLKRVQDLDELHLVLSS